MIEGLWLARHRNGRPVSRLGVAFMRVVNSMSLPVPMPIELYLAADRAGVPVRRSALIASHMITLRPASPRFTRRGLTLTPALKHEEALRQASVHDAGRCCRPRSPSPRCSS